MFEMYKQTDLELDFTVTKILRIIFYHALQKTKVEFR